MDTCPDCGSPLVVIYPASKRVKTPAQICTVCYTLWFNGEKTELPEDWNRRYPIVAKRAEEVTDRILLEAIGDSSFRARKYFERVFFWAFSEGFTRAYAVFRSNFREGRMQRVRSLWKKVTIYREEDQNKAVIRGLSIAETEELTRLINLGKPSQKRPL